MDCCYHTANSYIREYPEPIFVDAEYAKSKWALGRELRHPCGPSRLSARKLGLGA
jgi:hypothetical protein